ncbi:MAG: AmmeMemoRadiSam system protein A [Desulfobulbus sp.]
MRASPDETVLTREQGEVLVRLARQEIARALRCPVDCPVSEAEEAGAVFSRKQGLFVTLLSRGTLRGCIGSLSGTEPLRDGVRRHALNAAFHDQRFAPLDAAELAGVHIEVSVLTTPEPLTYADSDELIRRLRPDVDGVILIGPGEKSATFLPQVWRQLPEPEQFLEHLCRKAGLAPDAWRSGQLRVLTYQVQSFEEVPRGGSTNA